MSYDEKTGKMNWRDELTWIAVSIVCGLVLALIYFVHGRFPDASRFAVVLACSLGFYALGVLLRIQNYRGRILTGKTGFAEAQLKWAFPILGFLIGLALLGLGS